MTRRTCAPNHITARRNMKVSDGFSQIIHARREWKPRPAGRGFIRRVAARLWDVYRRLDQARVRGSSQRVLADIVSLARYAIGHDDELAPLLEELNLALAG